MSTKNHNLSSYRPEDVPNAKGLKIAIAVAEWNNRITEALLSGAVSSLTENGVEQEDIQVFHVPGTFELAYAASKLQNTNQYDAIIAIGCVIKGETPHFDFISSAVSNALAQLNTEGKVPVIFGVLTTLNEQQAIDRAGGKYGNKGVEAGITAIKMASLF